MQVPIKDIHGQIHNVDMSLVEKGLSKKMKRGTGGPIKLDADATFHLTDIVKGLSKVDTNVSKQELLKINHMIIVLKKTDKARDKHAMPAKTFSEKISKLVHDMKQVDAKLARRSNMKSLTNDVHKQLRGSPEFYQAHLDLANHYNDQKPSKENYMKMMKHLKIAAQGGNEEAKTKWHEELGVAPSWYKSKEGFKRA